MPRYARNALILAKVETTAGVDAVPTGAANALLVANLTINPLKANNVSRDLIRPFFGGSEQLVGTATVEVSFDVELAASGTARRPSRSSDCATAGPPSPTGRRFTYVGEVLVNSTGPVSAGCLVQPSNRSVRYACRSASSNSTT